MSLLTLRTVRKDWRALFRMFALALAVVFTLVALRETGPRVPDAAALLDRIDELTRVVEALKVAHVGAGDAVEDLRRTMDKHTTVHVAGAPAAAAGGGGKRLIFYNRPPKTGSTSVRMAMRMALMAVGQRSAKCFETIPWNEMGLRTIVNRRDVDFYGCHTRLTPERFAIVSHLRGGNVTFLTSTRAADNIVLSAYLQKHRDRNIYDIDDDEGIAAELARYTRHVSEYPVNALYAFHGADEPLTTCPVTWAHVEAMRVVASRYEAVIDLSRPAESAAMVAAVTGLTPDFALHMNERMSNHSRMIATLAAVNTTHRSCGNELVHTVLTQQFQIIKDRLMQNRCFDEATGEGRLCDRVELTRETIAEHTRRESFDARAALRAAEAAATVTPVATRSP